MKIEEMVEIFLNSANFPPHALLILGSPSGYALNLKALIKVLKGSWTYQLSYEILGSTFERHFDKTNLTSSKKDNSQNPGFQMVKIWSTILARILTEMAIVAALRTTKTQQDSLLPLDRWSSKARYDLVSTAATRRARCGASGLAAPSSAHGLSPRENRLQRPRYKWK